jgi:vacuole morphology and inheritance protein 14
MNEFIVIAKDIMIQVSPSLLNHVLPLLAHSAPKIRETAMAANTSLFKLIVDLPIPATIKPFTPGSPTKVSRVRRESIQAPVKVGTITEDSLIDATESDFFDYESSVKALAVLFLDEHEETRIASLEWLLMLHNRSPKRILSHDETLFPALLKLLSDPSEAVIKRDLQLLAQISTHTDEAYFNRLVSNLLKLFSTDRKLLEVRGNLIIRQLCLGLHPERIYRSFAEILEKEEDLEFASIMVQNLSTILITAPELYEVRKRLKNLKDNFTLFVVLYRSWCHNPVASLALCLLAQMYEHAANLVHSFGDIEITVNFLLQVDKLVQLLESPVFTYLRLQLLEPERYYYLYKCLYGVLMLLPQSSAFATLRNRLNSVSALGYLPRRKDDGDTAKRSSTNKFSMDASKAQELLTHFNALQSRHERIRVRTEATTVRQRDRSSSSSRTPSRGTSKERDTSTMESDRRSSAAQLVSRNLKRLGK